MKKISNNTVALVDSSGLIVKTVVFMTLEEAYNFANTIQYRDPLEPLIYIGGRWYDIYGDLTSLKSREDSRGDLVLEEGVSISSFTPKEETFTKISPSKEESLYSGDEVLYRIDRSSLEGRDRRN